MRALCHASLLGCALFAAACGGMEPVGDGAAGDASSGTTAGTVVDTTSSNTTGADTSGTIKSTGTGGSTSTGGTTGTAGSTTTGGTTAGSSSTGGTGSGTAGTTGGTVTGGGNACTPDGWGNYAAAKFSTWCSNCHGTGFSTLAQVKNDLTDVQQRVTSKNMPKGQALDADTYTRLVKWMNCGLPQ